MNHALLPQHAFKMRTFITVGHAKFSIKRLLSRLNVISISLADDGKNTGSRAPDTGLLGYGGIIRKVAYLAIIAGGQHSDDD